MSIISSFSSAVEPARSALLSQGVEHPVHARSPRTRLDEGFEEYAAGFLLRHPEISAAVPCWADEVDFSEIEDEVEGTVFSFSKSIGDVELYGVGKLMANGAVHLENGGTPNAYLPGEVECQKVGDISQWMLDLARDLIAAAGLLRAEPKLLRRPAEVDDQLQRLDV